MIHNIAYILIFGKPLLMYAGITTLAFLLLTASVGALNLHGTHTIPFKWHPVLAVTTIILALLHAVLGLSIFFNF